MSSSFSKETNIRMIICCQWKCSLLKCKTGNDWKASAFSLNVFVLFLPPNIYAFFFLILKIIFFFTGCSLKLIVLSMLQSFLRPQYLVWCLSLCIVFLSFTKTEYVIIGSSPAQFKIDKPTSHNQDFTGKVKASFLLNIIASLIWQHSHCNVTGGVLYRIVE